MRIPTAGLPDHELFARLRSYRDADMPWREGRIWAYVFDPGPEAEDVLARAYTEYLTENALDPTVFPSARRLEEDVVSMAAHHLGGDAGVVGSFTSGGTESIILAVKAARDRARAERPGIGRPRIVLPTTAHAAFHKAAHYLDVDKVLVPVDPDTFRADPEAMRAAITPDTVLLVGSAVSYAHGVVDPIRDLGQVAREHDLPLHVDACMGGFLLPLFRRLGRPVPDFDFGVPGVTSISMDLHKYAFAAKGASTILYRTAELRRHAMYACASWTGYTVTNPTVQSSRSAGPLAAAWAILHHFGEQGYLEIARRLLDATQRIVAGIDAIDGLRVLGEPDMNLVAFTSDEVNVFCIIDEMTARGWYVQPVLAFDSSPAAIHLSINPSCVRWTEAMLADLRESTAAAKRADGGATAAGARALLASIDPERVTPEALPGLLRRVGIEDGRLPARLAPVQEILNRLPGATRERLLVEFFNGA